MAALAGSLAAVGTMQADSLAQIQYVNNSSFAAGFPNGDGYQAIWDVDGDGDADSYLSVNANINGVSTTGQVSVNSANSHIYFATDGTGNDFVRFTVSDSVGPSANWDTGSGQLINFNSTIGDFVLGSAAENFLQSGDNYIGFRFWDEDSDDQHYGWANLNLDLVTRTMSITEWAWDDTADTAIGVADVPEPSSLALLAMGAGGLFAYRARRKKRSAEVTV